MYNANMCSIFNFIFKEVIPRGRMDSLLLIIAMDFDASV